MSRLDGSLGDVPAAFIGRDAFIRNKAGNRPGPRPRRRRIARRLTRFGRRRRCYPAHSSGGRRMSQDDTREIPLRFGPIRRGRDDRPCPLESRRSRARARLLLRHPRLRAGATLRHLGGVHLGRRLPPPHRPEHLGEPRRAAAAAAYDRPLPRRDQVYPAGRAGRRAAPAGRLGHPARRRQRSRRQRSALPARPRRQRRRAVLGSAGGAVAADRRRRAGRCSPVRSTSRRCSRRGTSGPTGRRAAGLGRPEAGARKACPTALWRRSGDRACLDQLWRERATAPGDRHEDSRGVLAVPSMPVAPAEEPADDRPAMPGRW